MRRAIAVVACGALCGAFLGFPWAGRVAPLAPLTLFPLLQIYRRGDRVASAWASALFAGAAFLCGLEWIYASAAAHQGPGAYYTSLLALAFECIPYAIAGFAAALAWRLPALLWCPTVASIWTLCEFWRSTSPFGIPYEQLGHALIDTPLVGIARAGGTPALTLLCVLVAAALFECARSGRKARVVCWAIFVALVTANAVVQRPKTVVAHPGLEVSVLQLGVVGGENVGRYLEGVSSLPAATRLAIWPESSLELSSSAVTGLIEASARRHRVALLVGGTVIDTTGTHDALEFVDAAGVVRGYYAKRQLVPFGEYLPFAPLAHAIIPAPIVESVPDLSPGRGAVTFAVGARTIGPLICYESAFPGLARDDVRHGANVLVAATNDAWFVQASGLWELAQTARLVAIETGTPMVLSGTVGPSGVIDANGRWTGSLRVGSRALATFSVPPAHPTLYDAVGDLPWIAVLAAFAACALLLATLRQFGDNGVDNGG